MTKPNDYHLMTYEQQEEWKRNQNRIEQSAWEADRAREDADRAHEEISRLNKISRQHRGDEAEEKNELLATIEQLQTQNAAIVDALNAAVCHIERMNETATDQAKTPESELEHMRAAIEAAEG